MGNVRFFWNGSARSIAENAVSRLGRGKFLALAENARDMMEPFVPFDTGALVDSARVEAGDGFGRVIYEAPYAAAVYYGDGLSFGRERHSLATAFWDKACAGRR